MKPFKRADGRWQINFWDAERGKQRSEYFPAGPQGKRQAAEFIAEVKLKKVKQEKMPLAKREGLYLDELTQAWIDFKTVQGRKARWLQEWANAFNKCFAERLCRKPAHKITQTDVMAVIAAHYSKVSQSTRNRYLGYLKATFAYAISQGHLEKNPLNEWKKGKEERRKSLLTLADLRKISAAAALDPRLEHIVWVIEVAWHIPVRPGKDLLGLTFAANVDYDRGGVQVHHSKVNKDAFVTCDEAFMRQLYARQKQSDSGHVIEWKKVGKDKDENEFKGVAVKRVEGALQTAARRAKLAYKPCMYDIRHLWITTMVNKGIEPSVIAYLAGTSVEMIIDNYYEPHSAERARVAQVLPAITETPSETPRKVVGIADVRRDRKR